MSRAIINDFSTAGRVLVSPLGPLLITVLHRQYVRTRLGEVLAVVAETKLSYLYGIEVTLRIPLS